MKVDGSDEQTLTMLHPENIKLDQVNEKPFNQLGTNNWIQNTQAILFN